MNKEDKVILARVLCNHNVYGKCELDGSICGDLNCFEFVKYDRLENIGYRKESELARKIFTEFEKLMLDGAIGGKYPVKVINPSKYDEFKKKYIGEGK